MKRNAIKFLALCLVAVLCVACFAGCGDNQDAQDKGNTLVIGGIGPVTGAAADYGTGVKNGIQLAIDEINAAGGVNGIKLELNFQDDEHDAEKAVNAYNALKDKDMKLLIGTVTSLPCIAVVEKTHADNMFQITPSGSAIDCVKYDNAFRVCFNDPNQGTASAQYIAEKKLASKIAVIYDSSDVYSSGIYEKFNAEAAVQGLSIVTAQAFTADSKTDFSVQLQKIQASGAELVFLPIYYQEAALILQQASTMGLNVKYFGCDGLDGLAKQLGTKVELSNDVMLLTPFAADSKDQKSAAFVKAYKEKNNDLIPNQFAADGYDAVYAIKLALEKADIKDVTNMSASDLCDALKGVMTQIKLEGVTGTITWDKDGEPSKDPKAMRISVNGTEWSYTAMD